MSTSSIVRRPTHSQQPRFDNLGSVGQEMAQLTHAGIDAILAYRGRLGV